MSWKSRSSAAVLVATVLTGAGAATVANAVTSAQPPAPAASVAAAAPTVPASADPENELRTEQLAQSFDRLLAQVNELEQAVAAGAARATAAPAPTLQPQRTAPTADRTAPTADRTAAPGSEAPASAAIAGQDGHHDSRSDESTEPSHD
ncbi:MAG TPA: hypothetical protein VIK43_03635 [Cellulomonas sp.]